MADLFLSYARPDRAEAEALALALEAKGYSVWWDRHIEGGAEFSADIERELTAAKVVVVAWSEAARKSPWVKDEAGVGREHGKLVALSFDNEQPPLGFRQYHAVDFSEWNRSSDSGEFQALIKAIESRMREETGSSRADPVSGFTRKPHRRRRWIWAAVLILAIIAARYIVFTQFQESQNDTPGEAGTKFQQDTKAVAAGSDIPRVSVAVFKPGGGDQTLADMASALSEGVANGLSRFSWLKVASRAEAGSSSEIGVAYRLEGSLRQSGETLRLTVQLFKTATGEQVWGESYDRWFREGASLVIQDDLTSIVVASVADSHGALMRDLSEPVALKSPDEMSPYEAVVRNMMYRQRVGPDDHKVTLAALRRAVQTDPYNADAWAALASMYSDEHKHNFNQSPDSLDRALEAVRQALQLDPDNAFGTLILAEVYYFRQNLGAFRAAAEKAIRLNPYDSDSMAMIGILLSYGGEWERGAELAERAMSLNPNHPGWYRMGIVFDQLRRGDYEAALATAQRVDLPLYFTDPLVRALAHAYLGQLPEARQAAQEFLALWPYQDLAYFEDVHLVRWFYASPELISLSVRGLEMAGLDFD
jgi:TolB-like protein/predicted TPR repeat methyltransferase